MKVKMLMFPVLLAGVFLLPTQASSACQNMYFPN